MKAIDKAWNAAGRPGSIEIKLSPVRLNLWGIVAVAGLLAAGSALYVWLWGLPTAYGWGHYLGSFFSLAGLARIGGLVVAYLALQSLLTWVLTGCDRSVLRWRADSVGIGLHCLCPVRLSHYRWMLLTPGLLLGLLPAAYGLATGHDGWYQWGLWGLCTAWLDVCLLIRLRYFPGKDYYQEGSHTYQGSVIVREMDKPFAWHWH